MNKDINMDNCIICGISKTDAVLYFFVHPEGPICQDCSLDYEIVLENENKVKIIADGIYKIQTVRTV